MRGGAPDAASLGPVPLWHLSQTLLDQRRKALNPPGRRYAHHRSASNNRGSTRCPYVNRCPGFLLRNRFLDRGHGLCPDYRLHRGLVEMPRPVAMSPKSIPSTYLRMNTALCLSRILSKLCCTRDIISRASKSPVRNRGLRRDWPLLDESSTPGERRTSSLTTRTATEDTKLRIA